MTAIQNNKFTPARLRRTVLLSMLAAAGVVLSPLLRVPGMAPMQHFINVICAVLLGPIYALTCALLIAAIRMSLMGIDFLAVTGAVFGAVLSGLLYRGTGRLAGALAGEIIGTGLIGATVSYPVMAFVYGSGDVALFTYVPSFLIGAVIGGSLGVALLKILSRQRILENLQQRLWEDD